MSKLPRPLICVCGYNTMDTKEALAHIEKHPEFLPNCKDLGKGIPCGNYPARTSDECVFCRGTPR